MSTEDREEAIFDAAIQLKTLAERDAYLAGACNNDKDLRAKVDELLKYHDAGGFIDDPVLEAHVTLDDAPLTEGPGTIIGKYKLLEKVGEGGMGVVYMAEQKEPVRRKVALKIIKLGMDTKQVIARFEAERQALALMDHPNIAKVLDAGATETGRPYFAMELVRGVPITEYCDKNTLSTRERLDLFIPICQAIQHAHQKGIIHRDIKPTNIMITLHDGDPVPKIIDFGIAKATNQQLTEKTLFTRYSQMIGTPEYMSPEQAEMSGLDIDTRSDIYSLGVLLYELLTGTTPLDADTLRKAGYAQMQRIICDEEPDKPSTKLSTLGDKATDIAKHRSTQLEALRKLIQGDLDWVVMKALEKNRNRRYSTVVELVADIERHIKNEPVAAAAPSFTYKLAKFTRRNQSLVASAAIILIVLIAGIISSVSFSIWANYEREIAQSATDEANIQQQYAENNLILVMQALEFKQTFELLGQLAKEFPNTSNLQRELTTNYVKLLTSAKNKQSDIIEEYDQNIQQIITDLKVLTINKSQYQLLPALIYNDLGTILTNADQLDQGINYYNQAFYSAADLPETDEFLSNLAWNCYNQALTFWKGYRHQHWASDDYLILSINIQKQLTENNPDTDSYRNQLEIYSDKAFNCAWTRTVNWDYGRRNPSCALKLALSATKAELEIPIFFNVTGWTHYNMNQLDQALKAANKSIELDDGEYIHWNFILLAVIHYQMGDKQKAHDYYDQVVELIQIKMHAPFNINSFMPVLTEAEVLLGVPESDILYQDRFKSWRNRGYLLGHLSRWEEAISAFNKALEYAENPLYMDMFSKATAQLGMNDIEGYRQTCKDLRKRFNSSTRRHIVWLSAWAHIQSSDATEDWTLVLDWFENAEKWLGNPKMDERLSVGWALYRVGRFSEAIEKLDATVSAYEQTGWPTASLPSYSFFFLAMAHHQLGHDVDAQKWLTLANKQIDKDIKEISWWHINISIKLLRNEAEALVYGPPRDADPIRPYFIDVIDIPLKSESLILDKTIDRQPKP